MPDVTVRLSRDEVKRRLRQLPGALCRTASDLDALGEAVLLAVGREALAILHEAYLVKSRGGTDAAGTSWPPRKNQKLGPRASRTAAPARRIPPARFVELGDRPIGVRTGRLVASLEPGAASADQVLETTRGGATVGTRVPYAEKFARLRPIVPDDWPPAWLDRLAAVLLREAERVAVELVTR